MRFLYGLVGVAFALALVLYPMLAVTFPEGAPPGYNGAPGAPGGNCTSCHFSFELNSGTGSVSIDAPATFAPGETITFTVAVDNTTEPVPDGLGLRQGFEVSVQDGETIVGTLGLADTGNTQFASGDGNYVTHTEDGNQLSEWTVQWTAPADSVAPESVTIYAAGNAGNGGEGFFGDYIYTDSTVVTRRTVANEDEAAPLAARLEAVYPNPVTAAATVAFTLDRPRPVAVTLYDGLGRTVRVLSEGPRAAGPHTLRLATDGLPAGVYFVEVRTADGADLRPVTVVR